MCTFDRRWVFERGDYAAACRARVAFRDALTIAASDEADVDAAEIVFGELVTNSLRHSGTCASVRVRCEAAAFVLEVRDCGPGFDLSSAMTTETNQREGGRGLLITRRLGVALRVAREDGKTLVEAKLPIDCRGGAA